MIKQNIKTDREAFLPQGYKVPTESKYMKFHVGKNQFRIMSSPIIGYEYWVDSNGNLIERGKLAGKGGKPVRKRVNEKISADEYASSSHFWAMVVYNYEDSKFQILEIMQSGILKSLQALVKDVDWGNPKGDEGYDILITAEGEGKEREYQVNPKPRKELPEGVADAYKFFYCDLNQLFSGGDPFKKESNPVDSKEEVFPEDIPI